MGKVAAIMTEDSAALVGILRAILGFLVLIFSGLWSLGQMHSFFKLRPTVTDLRGRAVEHS